LLRSDDIRDDDISSPFVQLFDADIFFINISHYAYATASHAARPAITLLIIASHIDAAPLSLPPPMMPSQIISAARYCSSSGDVRVHIRHTPAIFFFADKMTEMSLRARGY
jgi:hypothetical protein